MKQLWILSAAVVLAACSPEEPGEAAPGLAPVSVSVTEAWSEGAAVVHAGRVEATQEAEVATRVTGTLRRIAVRVGDRVSAGQVLVVLDAGEVDARIQAARARMVLAERTQGRIARLAEDGAASRQELDEATAALESARASLTEANAQEAYVRLSAPFGGVVTARHADPGDLAVPGRPVLSLMGTSGRRVAADLPAGLAGAVVVGSDVRVVGSEGEVETRSVSRVAPTLDATTRRFRVEVDLGPATDLAPGSVVRLEFPGLGGASRWIPMDAVIRRGQLEGIFTVEDETLRLRWLRLGRTVGDAVELLAGPAGPLRVVRRPDAALRDGQPVSSQVVEAAR